MNNIYKITPTSIFVYFYKILLQTIILTLVVIVLVKFYKSINDVNFLVYVLGVFLPWFIIFGLPLFLLFFNHYKYSKNVILKQNGNSFIYSYKSKSIEFKVSDIQKIELWLTPPTYDKRIDWQYFGKYHFTRIYTVHNQIINISCLVFDKTEEVFSEELIKKKKKFFPFMIKNQLNIKKVR